MPATATDTWTLTGTVATTRSGTTEARLDLATPVAGLVIREAGSADRVLGVDLRADGVAPVDRWIRGADVTAIYEPDDSRRLRATAMWRALSAPVAAWELVVSAQTSLLRAAAELAVVSEVAGDDVSWADPADGRRWTRLGTADAAPPAAAFFLVRREATGVVVAVHPQDPRRVGLAAAAGRTRIACGLFPTAIEKGVILRSRVLAAVGPAAGADRWAADLCVAFAASPPFLDT